MSTSGGIYFKINPSGFTKGRKDGGMETVQGSELGDKHNLESVLELC